MAISDDIKNFALDAASSERLNLIRFPLIVGVVFVHAYASTVGFAGEEIGLQDTSYFVQFARELISNVLAGVAVPTFFLISGFLFYYRFNGAKSEYIRKFRSRVHTLVIPFLLWNVLVIVLFAVAQTAPVTSSYFSGKSQAIASFSLYDYLNAIFGFTRLPISYQFWFIRDLIVVVALTPVLTVMLKRIPYLFLGIFGLAWYFDFWPITIPSAEALFFFYVGALLAVKRINPFSLDRFGKSILGIYLVIALADAATTDMSLNVYLHRLGLILGIVSALYLTKALLDNERLRAALTWLSACSFFVFAAHEPLLSAVRNIGFRVVNPTSDIEIMALYLFSPIFVIIVLVYAYRICQRVLPLPTRIASGGR